MPVEALKLDRTTAEHWAGITQDATQPKAPLSPTLAEASHQAALDRYPGWLSSTEQSTMASENLQTVEAQTARRWFDAALDFAEHPVLRPLAAPTLAIFISACSVNAGAVEPTKDPELTQSPKVIATDALPSAVAVTQNPTLTPEPSPAPKPSVAPLETPGESVDPMPTPTVGPTTTPEPSVTPSPTETPVVAPDLSWADAEDTVLVLDPSDEGEREIKDNVSLAQVEKAANGLLENKDLKALINKFNASLDPGYAYNRDNLDAYFSVLENGDPRFGSSKNDIVQSKLLGAASLIGSYLRIIDWTDNPDLEKAALPVAEKLYDWAVTDVDPQKPDKSREQVNNLVHSIGS